MVSVFIIIVCIPDIYIFLNIACFVHITIPVGIFSGLPVLALNNQVVHSSPGKATNPTHSFLQLHLVLCVRFVEQQKDCKRQRIREFALIVFPYDIRSYACKVAPT